MLDKKPFPTYQEVVLARPHYFIVSEPVIVQINNAQDDKQPVHPPRRTNPGTHTQPYELTIICAEFKKLIETVCCTYVIRCSIYHSIQLRNRQQRTGITFDESHF